ALDEARADVETANATLRNLDAQIAQQRSAIDQDRADITSNQAALEYATTDTTRYDNLMKTGYGTVQRAELAGTALREKAAALARSNAGLKVAERKVDVL